MTNNAYQSRPLIHFYDGKIVEFGQPKRVVLRKEKISVGCRDVSVEALKFLLSEWEKKFGADGLREYVIQDGSSD